MKLPGLVTAAALATVSSAASAACKSPFRWEPDPRLSLTDVAHFGEAESFENEDAPARYLVVQWYDEEDRPYRKHVPAVGVVYAATGDEGEPGIGGRLWSKVQVDLDKDQMKALNQSNGSVNVVFVARESLGACGRPTFKLRFDKKGDIFVEGRKIGNMQ